MRNVHRDVHLLTVTDASAHPSLLAPPDGRPRCHRGEEDSGDSQVVLTLRPDAVPQRPRSVEIVSIGLHFYAGHGSTRTPKDLSDCHDDSGGVACFHPFARCLGMEELKL